MNYYQFHLGDYSSHTRYLSLLEDLAYRRMLDLYYASERPLPLEIEKIARLIGMSDQIREVSDIVSDFFLKSEDGYRNKRADEEIAAYHAKAGRARKANKSRWDARESVTLLKSDPKSDLISDVNSEAHQIPTNNHKPITNNQIEERGAKAPAPQKRFVKPTLVEVRDEFARKGSVNPDTEAIKFINHYESNGWRVGKNPMKSWQATVTTWVARRNENAQSQYAVGQSRAERNEVAFYAELARLEAAEAALEGLGDSTQSQVGELILG